VKISKPFIALALALAGLTAASSVFAWHHRGPRVSIGFGFGYPYPYPYYYPPPPYYYPPYYPAPVVLQRPPVVYIESSPQATPSVPAASSYWYYCADSNAYYPYVKECAVGWQRVPPRPG
jgi:hypothetical protein